MSQIDSFTFTCGCGNRITASAAVAGKKYTCNACRRAGVVPNIHAPIEMPKAAVAESPVLIAQPQRPAWVQEFGDLVTFRTPVTFKSLFLYLLLAWLVVFMAAAVVSLFSITFGLIAWAVCFTTTIAVAHQLWVLLNARKRVLAAGEVSLLYGMLSLVAWNPTEGILVLRNKAISFYDDNLSDGSGGIRFIFPIMGDEIALRAPLEVQTFDFADHDVLTREYLRLTVRATMRWRVTDIKKFYLLVSRELSHLTERADPLSPLTTTVFGQGKHDGSAPPVDHLLHSAMTWLRGLAEAETRTVVSRVNSGLLIANHVMAELPEMKSNGLFGGDGHQIGNGADGLGVSLRNKLIEDVADYGITIEDVSLREIRFPEEIMAQCIAAARTAYLPLQGQREAIAATARLRQESDVLGKDIVGTRQIVEKAPAFALVDFMSSMLKNLPQTNLATGVPGVASPAAVVAGAIAAEGAKAAITDQSHDN